MKRYQGRHRWNGKGKYQVSVKPHFLNSQLTILVGIIILLIIVAVTWMLGGI